MIFRRTYRFSFSGSSNASAEKNAPRDIPSPSQSFLMRLIDNFLRHNRFPYCHFWKTLPIAFEGV